METTIGLLEQRELDSADSILRRAFGTFLGLPDPSATFGDCEKLRNRWKAENTVVLAARRDGELLGTNVVTRWGSLGLFGPLSVRPDVWNQGVARALLMATMPVFERWGVIHRGLFTRATSPKHVTLYQRFGYWPRFLTPIMSRTLDPVSQHAAGSAAARRFSRLDSSDLEDALRQCGQLAEGIHPGLNLGSEIQSVQNQSLGDTILNYEDSQLKGFAICHLGAGTEAGSGSAYTKFAMVEGGNGMIPRLANLLGSVEEFAKSEGVDRVEIGINTAHHEAYCHLVERGYRIEFLGLAMETVHEAGYHRSGVAVLDDWR